MLRREAPRHPDRRRRAASAAEGQRLLAVRRQDQGVRRRHRDHRQLGQRHGAADQGGGRRRPKVIWYTYYAGGTGAPTAIGRRGVDHACTRSPNGIATCRATTRRADFRRRSAEGTTTLSIRARQRDAACSRPRRRRRKSIDPVKVARALEGMKLTSSTAARSRCARTITSSCSRCTSRRGKRQRQGAYDEENTGWGWQPVAKIDTRRPRSRRPAR